MKGNNKFIPRLNCYPLYPEIRVILMFMRVGLQVISANSKAISI